MHILRLRIPLLFWKLVIDPAHECDQIGELFNDAIQILIDIPVFVNRLYVSVNQGVQFAWLVTENILLVTIHAGRQVRAQVLKIKVYVFGVAEFLSSK